jgi:hypothetical protein
MPTRHQLSRYPDHVKAIGMIALETVDLELELGALLSRMLLLNPLVGEAIYMTPRGDQTRLDILRNAAKEVLAPSTKRDPKSEFEQQKRKALDKINRIVARAQACIGKRNRALHDDWHISAETKEIARVRVDGTSSRVGDPIPIDQLKGDIRALRTLIDDVTALAKEFRKKPPWLISMKL